MHVFLANIKKGIVKKLNGQAAVKGEDDREGKNLLIDGGGNVSQTFLKRNGNNESHGK